MDDTPQVPFHAVIHEVSGVPVVRARGELCHATAPLLEEVVRRAALAGGFGGTGRPRLVVADLSGVRFVDSEGMKAIFACIRRLEERGIELRVVAPEGWRPMRVFDVAGVADRLPLYRSVTAAVGSGPGGAG